MEVQKYAYTRRTCQDFGRREGFPCKAAGASADPQRRRRPVNMISFEFDQFNFKLSPSAQVWTCANSLAQVLELTAGTIT